MTYVLGVDLGTTYSAAAVWREGRAEIVTLGAETASIPSIVVLRADGEVLVGEAAERRARTEPARAAREFKRRLGDPTPIVIGGTPYGAEALLAHLLRWIVRTVTEREGEAPSVVVLTHPASWGPYKTDLLRQAARLADVTDVQLVTEPEAAAVHYASRERVEAERVVAVYDFGGGTFDAAVLRRTADGFALIGEPEGMERLGGIDLDQAVMAHVSGSLDNLLDDLDTSDPATLEGLARLREDSRRAKEALSADADTSISVALPGLATQVRLTRAEFEDMVRPRIVETVDALGRAVRSAGVAMEELAAIVLVGGSSRIPLVAEVVGGTTGVHVAVDTHPKHSIALGAATIGGVAADAIGAATMSEEPQVPAPPPPPAPPAPAPPPASIPTEAVVGVSPSPSPAAAVPTIPAVAGLGVAPAGSEGKRSLSMLVMGGVTVVAALLIGFTVLGGGGDDDDTASPTTPLVDDDAKSPGDSTSTTEEVTTTEPPTTAAPTTTTSDDPSSTTRSVPEPPLPMELVRDASGTIGIEVPEAWDERLTNPVNIDGVNALQISAAKDMDAYTNAYAQGISVFASDAAEAGTPDEVIAALAPPIAPNCEADTGPHAGPRGGVERVLVRCGGTDTKVQLVAFVDGDTLVLVTGNFDDVESRDSIAAAIDTITIS